MCRGVITPLLVFKHCHFVEIYLFYEWTRIVIVNWRPEEDTELGDLELDNTGPIILLLTLTFKEPADFDASLIERNSGMNSVAQLPRVIERSVPGDQYRVVTMAADEWINNIGWKRSGDTCSRSSRSLLWPPSSHLLHLSELS